MFFLRLSEQSHSRANGLTTISPSAILLIFVHSHISNLFVLIIPKLVWRSVFVVWFQPISERVLLIFTRSHFSSLSLSTFFLFSSLQFLYSLCSSLPPSFLSRRKTVQRSVFPLSLFPPPLIILQGGVSQLWQSHFIYFDMFTSTLNRVPFLLLVFTVLTLAQDEVIDEVRIILSLSLFPSSSCVIIDLLEPINLSPQPWMIGVRTVSLLDGPHFLHNIA